MVTLFLALPCPVQLCWLEDWEDAVLGREPGPASGGGALGRPHPSGFPKEPAGDPEEGDKTSSRSDLVPVDTASIYASP